MDAVRALRDAAIRAGGHVRASHVVSNYLKEAHEEPSSASSPSLDSLPAIRAVCLSDPAVFLVTDLAGTGDFVVSLKQPQTAPETSTEGYLRGPSLNLHSGSVRHAEKELKKAVSDAARELIIANNYRPLSLSILGAKVGQILSKRGIVVGSPMKPSLKSILSEHSKRFVLRPVGTEIEAHLVNKKGHTTGSIGEIGTGHISGTSRTSMSSHENGDNGVSSSGGNNYSGSGSGYANGSPMVISAEWRALMGKQVVQWLRERGGRAPMSTIAGMFGQRKSDMARVKEHWGTFDRFLLSHPSLFAVEGHNVSLASRASPRANSLPAYAAAASVSSGSSSTASAPSPTALSSAPGTAQSSSQQEQLLQKQKQQQLVDSSGTAKATHGQESWRTEVSNRLVKALRDRGGSAPVSSVGGILTLHPEDAVRMKSTWGSFSGYLMAHPSLFRVSVVSGAPPVVSLVQRATDISLPSSRPAKLGIAAAPAAAPGVTELGGAHTTGLGLTQPAIMARTSDEVAANARKTKSDNGHTFPTIDKRTSKAAQSPNIDAFLGAKPESIDFPATYPSASAEIDSVEAVSASASCLSIGRALSPQACDVAKSTTMNSPKPSSDQERPARQLDIGTTNEILRHRSPSPSIDELNVRFGQGAGLYDTSEFDFFSNAHSAASISIGKTSSTIKSSSECLLACATLQSERLLAIYCQDFDKEERELVVYVVGHAYTFLFKPFYGGGDLFDAGLRKLFSQDDIVKVFHDCRRQVELFARYQVHVAATFDTQVAFMIVRPQQTRASYASVAREVFGRDTHQSDDWSDDRPGQFLGIANSKKVVPHLQQLLRVGASLLELLSADQLRLTRSACNMRVAAAVRKIIVEPCRTLESVSYSQNLQQFVAAGDVRVGRLFPLQTQTSVDFQEITGALPERINVLLHSLVPDAENSLVGISMDLFRPVAFVLKNGTNVFEEECVVNHDDIAQVLAVCGEVTDRDRAFVGTSLHRCSVVKDPASLEVIGVTLHLSRVIRGIAGVFEDLISTGDSVLFVGPPGCAKTTLLRDVSRALAVDSYNRAVLIIDTQNEIAGESILPHPSIGRARRLRVGHLSEQHRVMLDATRNHAPRSLIIDDISTPEDVLAADWIIQSGVQVVAGMRCRSFGDLIRSGRIGNFLGRAAKNSVDLAGRSLSPIIHQGQPSFNMVIEVVGLNKWRIYRDLNTAVGIIMSQSDESFECEVRGLKESGVVEITFDSVYGIELSL